MTRRQPVMNEFDCAALLASTDDETLKHLWFLSRKDTFTLIRASEKVLKAATSDAEIPTNPKARQMAVDYCRHTITAARRWLRLVAVVKREP